MSLASKLPPDQVFFTLTDTARILGKSRRTVNRWTRTGGLRTVTPGGASRRYVHRETLEKLLAEPPRRR